MGNKIASRSHASRRHKYGLLSFTMLGVAAASPAMAQQIAPGVPTAVQNASPTQGLEEIIVTAQKRGENLQKVPIAVAAFSAATLKAANINGISDLVKVTPSLNFSYSGPVGSPYLRGVGSGTSYAGAEAEVQTYIDNVYYASGGAAFLKFNNIDRIEVDKGPQGTLFGRNATGGVIQIFTRDPSHDPMLDASFGYGNFNSKEANVYASTGLGDKLAADISVHYDDHDGWGRNFYLNKDVYAARSIGVRSKWVLNASDSTRLTFIADYGQDRSDFGEVQVFLAAPFRASLAEPVPGFIGYDNVRYDEPTGGKLTHFGASMKLDQKFGDLTFVSITGYRGSRSYSHLDVDETPDPILVGIQHTREDQVSQEFQLLSPTGNRFQWILGTYLYYNKASADPATLSGEFLPPGAVRVDNYSTMTTKSAAVFAQATYNLTDTTHITAGIRYTYDHRDQVGHVNLVLAPPVGAIPFPGLGQNLYPHAHFQAPSGKVTIAQDLSNRTLVYATYSRGFKSGTFNNQILLSDPMPALKPEYINAYEIGVKSELLDGKLRANLAGFYYKYSNLQVNVFEQFSIAVLNAASSTIKGVDGDFEYLLTAETRLTASFSYLHARYDNFPDAPLYTILSPTTPNRSIFGGYGGLQITGAPADGHTMPHAPNFSGDFGVRQTVDTGFGKIDLNADVAYQGKTYFTADNRYSQPGFATVSASAKLTSENKKWDLTLWVSNLTNVRRFADLSLSAVGVAGYPNQPRSFGARVGLHL